MTERGMIVICVILVAMLTLVAPKSNAVEPLSTKELAEHCIAYEDDPVGGDAIFCVRYVQGFIDGAVATDERVALNVVAEIEEDESFSERAIRLRAPSKRVSRYGATVYAEFCLGEPVALKEVVEHVIDDLKNRKVVEETLLAREAVYAVLRRDYPCETNDD